MPNLQIKRFDASLQIAGVVAAATQDNGDVSCSLTTKTVPTWRPLDGSDGVKVLFVTNNTLLFYDSTLTLTVNGVTTEFGNVVRDARYDPAAETFAPQAYIVGEPLDRGVIPVDGTSPPAGFAVYKYGLVNLPGGRESAAIDAVFAPAYTNSNGETMVAISAISPDPNSQIELYGLFVRQDSNFQTNPMHWAQLYTFSAQPNEHAVAVASQDGTSIWVGTGQGRIIIFVVGPAGVWLDFDQTPTSGARAGVPIQKFCIVNDGLAYAIGTTSQLFKMSLRFPSPGNAERIWNEITGPSNASNGYGGYMALAIDWTVSPPTVFVGTDTTIWRSGDGAETWSEISG